MSKTSVKYIPQIITEQKDKCPKCGYKLWRGLCPHCNYDKHPERVVKRYVFPDTL